MVRVCEFSWPATVGGESCIVFALKMICVQNIANYTEYDANPGGVHAWTSLVHVYIRMYNTLLFNDKNNCNGRIISIAAQWGKNKTERHKNRRKKRIKTKSYNILYYDRNKKKGKRSYINIYPCA